MQGPRFFSVGEILLDLHEDTRFAAFLARPGGAALNRARVLASLGANVALVGAAGEGATGTWLMDAAAQSGIDTRHVRRSAARSGVVMMYREAVGGHRCVPYREGTALASEGAQRLRAKHVRAAWLLVDGILSAERASARAIDQLVAIASARGVELFVDLNLRPAMWHASARGRLRKLLGRARVVKASTVDLEALGVRAPERWLHKNAREGATIVLTRGERGSRTNGPWGELSLVPARVGSGDATGAGDAFAAGLVWRLAALSCGDESAFSRPGTWTDALETAAEVAETTIGRLGCDPEPGGLRLVRQTRSAPH